MSFNTAFGNAMFGLGIGMLLGAWGAGSAGLVLATGGLISFAGAYMAASDTRLGRKLLGPRPQPKKDED